MIKRRVIGLPPLGNGALPASAM
ncbi:hypothetical protein FG05_35059 [Fusarium graminearum]|nr:hypothetical protein FG05_35059 [Fusarium graminearum]